jgi:hypothetical protein
MPHATLEDIILSHDRRGMTALRPHLPADYCQQAGQLLLENYPCVLITTGFYVTRLSAPETDGPPGALAIGRAVTALGGRAVYVSDQYTAPLLRAHATPDCEVVCYPICDEAQSRAAAQSLLHQYRPSLMLSTERCGVTASGVYRNCLGQDISAYTARLDTLFRSEIPSLGIGDGGNEIGMGKLARVIPSVPGLPREPAITATTALVIASVSNWGAYGVVAALSALAGRDLLPKPDAEEELIAGLFAGGCYDGTQPQPACGVDGFSLQENSRIIQRLSLWLHEVRQ